MRFCPRFSVRTLAIVVTLVCVYFGAWEATKRYGINIDLDWPARRTVLNALGDSTGPPQIRLLWGYETSPAALIIVSDEPISKRKYYLWLFGPRFKLPYESNWE
jgi:hypothetical protein